MNDPKRLFFFTPDEVVSYNYLDEDVDDRKKTVCEYNESLDDVPTFGVFNKAQTVFIVTTPDNALYCEMGKPKETQIDLDKREEVALIQNISVSEDDSQFFVLANKKEQKLGYYLFIVRLDDPEAKKRPKGKAEYLIAWENKLDIGNCDVAMLVETDADKKRRESVVVSYKCIGINTFNVFVFDLETKLIRYWHESF